MTPPTEHPPVARDTVGEGEAGANEDQRIKAADPAVLPLTLYRLTLETDSEESFDMLKYFFINKFPDREAHEDFILALFNAHKDIVGVETRVRERLTR